MNMQNMMKQVKKMQQEMEKAQEALKHKTVVGTAGGGAVTVEMNGHKEVQKITLTKEAVDPEDLSMLEDLLVLAVNDALSKADALAQEDLGKITGGLNLPGLF
ncbi:MAG: YbaB/EbfC family nucleoid-associated protein [Candidatus Carbobacillus sp.]|nr:YbaB/EbfC family nucleoid-associated protein [Candidatus Carbobacillus sp.]